MCWATASPGRPITLRFLSLFEHREIIEAARDFCEQRLRRRSRPIPEWRCWQRQFTDTERVEYLDKS